MTTMSSEYHNPVLLKESVDGLNIKDDGVYVDVTFGGGPPREFPNKMTSFKPLCSMNPSRKLAKFFTVVFKRGKS